jgi:hypothetical protein
LNYLVRSLATASFANEIIQPEQKWHCPNLRKPKHIGAIAQLGERLPCTQEVSGSIPLSSTNYLSLMTHYLKVTSAKAEIIFK